MAIRTGEQYIDSLRDGRRLFNDGKIGPLMDKWLVGPGIDAKRRLELMKLAWDIIGSEFGSRAGLYERLYSGDPEINARGWFRSGITKGCEALVHELLKP